MVRPVSFRMNEQTAVNNFYQKEKDGLSSQVIQQRALQEFDNFVRRLRIAGVNVIVVDDNKEDDTPDSIFPNNWISFHEGGIVAVYPMFAENRRKERREDILLEIENNGFIINQIIDYSAAELEGVFLEGTGSLVLDRVNRIAYCAASPRAHEELLIEFCEDFEYTPVYFHAYQTVGRDRELIYHTNVMMALTEEYAIVCLDCIDDKKEKKHLVDQIELSGKKIIAITEDQVGQFAGNMLQLRGRDQQKFTVMSEAAFSSLKPEQI